MAKNKNNSKPRGFTAQSAYKWIRLAALGLPAISVAMSTENNRTKLVHALEMYTGFHIDRGTFSWEALQKGYLPVVAATAVTYGIPKLAGLIRGIK